MTFEKSMKRLEEITEKLEQRELPLEEAIALYQEGLELLKSCNQKLAEAEELLESTEKITLEFVVVCSLADIMRYRIKNWILCANSRTIFFLRRSLRRGKRGSKMFDVVSAGDIMIDFSQCGYGPNGNPAYEMNPGGAPANMLVACSLLGAKTAFIGKVGDDLFGRHVAGALKRYGISDEGVVYTTIDHTMISFVSFDEDGDRSFYFVGKGVDHLLTADEVNRSVLDRANIIYSTYGLAKSPNGSSTLRFLQDYAEQHGKLFAVDPNYRPESNLHNPETVKAEFTEYISRADIVKVSEIELGNCSQA